MAFRSASDNIITEQQDRIGIKSRLLSFGVKFLDDAMTGIFPDDLILLGAPSGVGKTQICVNIALANIENAKRVHFIALEASEFEIERRLKYKYIANYFFSDENRPRLKKNLTFTDWYLGEYENELKLYEDLATEFCHKAFGSLFTFYKSEKFDVFNLIENIHLIENDTDLIILDHIHYLDWDDPNDNRAIKEIAKKVRSLALECQKPIILVAHLRKKDRGNKEIAASLDEFHGSSDLSKIATKVITIAPGPVTDDGKYTTYFRIPKNRLDGGVTRYVGATTFSPKKGGYDDEYSIGFANTEKFFQLTHHQYPQWAKFTHDSSMGGSSHSRESDSLRAFKGSVHSQTMFNPSERN